MKSEKLKREESMSRSENILKGFLLANQSIATLFYSVYLYACCLLIKLIPTCCLSLDSKLKEVSFDAKIYHFAPFSGHCASKQSSITFKENAKIQQPLEHATKKNVYQENLNLTLKKNDSMPKKVQHYT